MCAVKAIQENFVDDLNKKIGKFPNVYDIPWDNEVHSTSALSYYGDANNYPKQYFVNCTFKMIMVHTKRTQIMAITLVHIDVEFCISFKSCIYLGIY